MHLELQGDVVLGSKVCGHYPIAVAGTVGTAGSRNWVLPIDGSVVAKIRYQNGNSNRDAAADYLQKRMASWTAFLAGLKWSAMHVPKIHCWLLARHTGIVQNPPEVVSRGGPERRENRHCWMAACVMERCEPCEVVHERARALMIECFAVDGIELQYDSSGPGQAGTGPDGVLKLLDITDATGREYL